MSVKRRFVFFLIALVGCVESSGLTQSSAPHGAVQQDGESQPTAPPDDLGVAPEYRSRVEEWYAGHLEAMQESKYLAAESTDSDTIRFLYLPSFDNPLLVRIEKSGNQITLVSKRLSGKGGYNPGELTTKTKKELTTSVWQSLQGHLVQSRFWNLSTFETRHYLDENGMQVGWGTNDGAQWIVEVFQDGKYHVVDRQSPDDSWHRDCAKFRRLCVYMVKLAELNPGELY